MAERPPASQPQRPRPPAGGVPPRPSNRPPGVAGLSVWAIVAIGLAVAFLVWLLFIQGGDDEDDAGQLAGPQAEKSVDIVTENALRSQVSEAGYPVYWLGPRQGVSYELTLITDGRAYVRYLPSGEPAETETPYLTVGSYLQQNAYGVLGDLGNEPGANSVRIPDGGRALTNEGGVTGVYVAFPGTDTQIEIFDPQPGRALELAKSGALTQVR